MQLKRILVTTDFSDLSRRAFAPAASLARKVGAQLHLIHVLESLPPILFSPEGVVAYSPELDYRTKIQVLLEKIASEPVFAGLDVEPHLLEGGYVHDRVTRFQERNKIDLTVIATHGRNGMSQLFMGSFAERVLRTSATPLLVYRPREGKGKGLETEFAPKRILVPFDFSENARIALEPARFLAKTFGSRVRLLYVQQLFANAAIMPWELMAAEDARQPSAEASAKARKELEEVFKRDLPETRPIDAEAIVGNPYLEIADGARRYEADLIVMSTHGRTGFQHLIVGSVAEKTVQKAPCPVLILRPSGAVQRK